MIGLQFCVEVEFVLVELVALAIASVATVCFPWQEKGFFHLAHDVSSGFAV